MAIAACCPYHPISYSPKLEWQYPNKISINLIPDVLHALRHHCALMLIEDLRALRGFPKDSVTTCVVDDLHPYVEVLVMIVDTLMQGRRWQALLREAYSACWRRFHAIYLLKLKLLYSLISTLNLPRILDTLAEALSIGQNQIQQASSLIRYSLLNALLAL